ncbi:MAG: NAD-dependent epimerase/dehydratase family protein [Candidatus Omnitrophica bacterium]|nr:NAD-dependent epimerase/dehydratase family protein [Candidatus Omnitrophota bacterium]
MAKILVTGGCGFVGSHLVDRLVSDGHKVRVYDILEPQVHGVKKPAYLNKGAEYIYADIRNKEKLKKAIKDIEFIFHEASQVGVGQSMYEIEKYVTHNSYGTAVLLDLLVNTKNKVRKIVVASSMSIYGEGAYRCASCGAVYPQLRKEEQLNKKKWEMQCPRCAKVVSHIPTFENKPLFPTSIYATTKRCQEEMCLEIGNAYKIPAVALRYFNIYGPRQSLNNPYTGVCAIFLSRIKNNRPPLIFEDGKQSRDFIHVGDIVEANMLAMKNKKADYKFFNVGTGISHSILEVAQKLTQLCGKKFAPGILNRFRAGDIRHCYADISKIKSELGFVPKVSFTKGLRELIEWSESQEAVDLTRRAQGELKRKGLSQ